MALTGQYTAEPHLGDRNVETSFGAWIKRRRKALDLTQAELAARVGCSRSAIFKIESNRQRPMDLHHSQLGRRRFRDRLA